MYRTEQFTTVQLEQRVIDFLDTDESEEILSSLANVMDFYLNNTKPGTWILVSHAVAHSELSLTTHFFIWNTGE